MSAPSPEIEIPREAKEVFSKFIAAEYAYFTPQGEPLCWPVTPYWDSERGVLAVATGLAYPNKADYAKRNPKVSLLFSDPTSSGLESTQTILVRGDAVVLDQDIQENTDRYVRELRNKFVAARVTINPLTVKMLDFYLPRLWIEITPRQLTYPESNDSELDVYPTHQIGVSATHRRLADRERAALRRLVAANHEAVLTLKGSDGYPAMKRMRVRVALDESIELERPAQGPACLTIHRHTMGGVRFQAYMVRGTAEGKRFIPKKLVGFFGNGFVFPFSVIPNVLHLRRTLKRELQRRGKSMPALRVPGWKML